MPANLSVVNGRSAAAMIGPGATLYKLIAVGTNADQNLIATGKRVVYSLAVSNANAAVRYVKLYNKATAPVVGTDVPVAVFALPAVNGINMEFSAGLAFPLGLGIGLTTGSADNNSTGVTAGESIVTLSYT
jgi:hypothetical protein